MGIEYMIFVQPGNKYMTSGNKVYGFLTIRKQIYAQWEKNICPMGKKIYAQREKIDDHFFLQRCQKKRYEHSLTASVYLEVILYWGKLDLVGPLKITMPFKKLL